MEINKGKTMMVPRYVMYALVMMVVIDIWIIILEAYLRYLKS